jgi:hypothetical protein
MGFRDRLMKRLPATLLVALTLALPGARAAAAEVPPAFPPVTAEERALTSVPGEPNAPAVVLFKKGELLMAGYGRFIGSLASHLRVQARVKILTEAGKSKGEIAIAHSGSLRLQNFSGRTVLPDGRIVPVPADARFERRTSKSSKTYVTTVAFPAVQVGAILDYEYEVTFLSPFVLEPWYFSEELPVRHAEIVCKMARGWTHRIWSRAPLGVKLEQEKRETPGGVELRAWAESLPAVPDVPYGPPYADLATQILLLPETYPDRGEQIPLMGTWAATTRLVNRDYGLTREFNWGVPSRARKAAGDGTPRQKAEALYRFVRDEIQTQPGEGVLVSENSRLQDVLSTRHGTAVEKALLLQVMLLEVDVKAYLVWAADRDRGTVDLTLANPSWFDTALVLVEIDSRRMLLDPSSPSLGFGQLRAGYEGTQALVFDTVQQVTLSETPFDRNLRRAEIDLSLGDDGRFTGHGTLTLTGLRAVERLHWKDGEAQTLQAWKEWLEERYADFRISELRAVESSDERKVTVTWSMAQREEEALGDEATLVPSAPLGPASQPFVEAERRLDLIFDYGSRDEVELRLRWPAAWSLEGRPLPAKKTAPCGELATSLELDADKRTLVYSRRLDITRRKLSATEYEAVRGLFGEAAKNDAQTLTLARRKGAA